MTPASILRLTISFMRRLRSLGKYCTWASISWIAVGRDHLLDPEVVGLLGVGIDVHLGDAAEQVVGIAHDVLVGAHQEEAQVVRPVTVGGVHRQEALVGSAEM
jgi:hypothetical protein